MNPDPASLDRMAQLSRRYARYSHSLPGLSLALGGITVFLMLFAPPLLQNYAQVCWDNQRGLMALTVAALLAGWILIKEWLRLHIYQSLGLAEAQDSDSGLAFNRVLAIALALLALAYPARMLAVQPHSDPAPTVIQIYIGLTACLAMPWITLRFIRGVQESLLWALLAWSALEFIWGLPDLNAAAAHSDGVAVFFILSAVLAFFGGLAAGLVQHFNFMRLAREVRAQETPDE
jgi:hypothetical protein